MATLTQADLAGWLLRDYPQCTRLLPLLGSVVRESCDLLVDAGLLEQPQPVYAVSPGGEVGGGLMELGLTSGGAALAADGRTGQWATAYIRGRIEEAHSGPWQAPGLARPGTVTWTEPGRPRAG